MDNFLRSIFILAFVGLVITKWDGNCNVPPNYDGYCCNEKIFDDDPATFKTCAQKFNLTVINNDVQVTLANLEAYVCLADCLFVAEKYINNGVLDMAYIKTDVTQEAKNFPELGTILINAFEKCSKAKDKIIEELKKRPQADKILKGKCSPTAEIISECADMEYFINCPAKYWTANNSDCEDYKTYATKCRIGM